MCYHIKYGHSRSNRIGVDNGSQKMSDTEGASWYDGGLVQVYPLETCPCTMYLHHIKLGRSLLNGNQIVLHLMHADAQLKNNQN